MVATKWSNTAFNYEPCTHAGFDPEEAFTDLQIETMKACYQALKEKAISKMLHGQHNQ